MNAYRTPNSISTDQKALYKAIARLIKKHWDFLDIRQFLEIFIASNEIMLDTDSVLTEGLNIIQKALDYVGYKEFNVKDLVIEYAVKQTKSQRNIEQIQNDYYFGKLSDRCFAIYGAGKV